MMSISQALRMVSLRMAVRALSAGFAAAFATLALIGITTDVTDTYDWVILIAISCLAGALVVTYFLGQTSKVATPAGVAAVAIGWLALGFSSLQPYLGVLSIVLACVALVVRIRMLLRGTCPVPTPSIGATSSDG